MSELPEPYKSITPEQYNFTVLAWIRMESEPNSALHLWAGDMLLKLLKERHENTSQLPQ